MAHGSKVLVVEDDLNTRMMMVLSIESRLNVSVLEAGSVDRAIELIENHPDIGCIIAADDLSGPQSEVGTYDLYQYVVPRKKTPFVLVSDEALENSRKFQLVELTGFVKKPFFPIPFAELVGSILRKGGAQPEPARPGEFCRVRVSTLIEFGAMQFDLYLKLSETKYVKVVREGDTFTSDDASRFSSKNVEFLYLHRDDCASFLRKLREEIVRETASRKLSFQMSYEISASTLEVIQEVSRKLGMTPETESLVWAAVDQAVAVVRKNPILFRLFRNLIADRDHYIIDHSVLLAHIAAGIASLQPWVNKTTYYQLVMAAFLHDITLTNPQVATIQRYDEFVQKRGSMTDEDRSAFICHPEEAANLVRQISAMPPDVDTLIIQHHERPDGTGFPNHLTGEKIRPISCVFIVAHEMVKYLYDVGDNQELARFVLDLHRSYAQTKGHFKAVLQTVQIALLQEELGHDK